MIFKLRTKKTEWEVGQGLVEALLAAVVVILVVYSLVNLGIIAIRSSNLANERNKAVQYANEGLEAIRIIRDRTNGWDDISSKTVGLDYCFADETFGLGFTLDPCVPAHEKRLERMFSRKVKFESIYREQEDNPPGACSTGCSACGRILRQGEPNYGFYADDCSRRIVVNIIWRSLGGVEYSVTSNTVLTSWR